MSGRAAYDGNFEWLKKTLKENKNTMLVKGVIIFCSEESFGINKVYLKDESKLVKFVTYDYNELKMQVEEFLNPIMELRVISL